MFGRARASPFAAALLIAGSLRSASSSSSHFLRLRGDLRLEAGSNEAIELELTNHDNVQYCGPIAIGDQELPVIYDTGSFDVIVLSSLCDSCSRQNIMYDSTKSASFVSAGDIEAEHLFGSGPVRSAKGFEDVRVGGAQSGLIARRTAFWQVTSHNIAVWDSSAHFSGIVGLGHPDQTPAGYAAHAGSSDFSLLARFGVERFSFCLARSGQAAPGRLRLWRGSPPGPLAPGFTPLALEGKAHWAVRMTGLEASGMDGNAAVDASGLCNPACGAIVDSGTSLIAVPSAARDFVETLAMMVHSDCSNLESLPTLRMVLGGVRIELPPRAYVMKVRRTSSDPSVIRRVFGSAKRLHECSPAFMFFDRVSQLGPTWILGMPFLRYYHTVFDRAGKQLYVAPSTPTCEVAPLGTAHLVANASAYAPTMTFTADDYLPTEVDLDQVRGPRWALASETGVSGTQPL